MLTRAVAIGVLVSKVGSRRCLLATLRLRMALHEAEGPVGAPWERPLAGVVDRFAVESELLAQNPLGDPSRRPLYVYRSPGVVSGKASGPVPSVYVIQGFTGQADMWLSRTPFEPTMIERLDAMFASGECPDAIVVFVDAWTSYGGSQFLDSPGTGNYHTYLCDEIVPWVDEHYRTLNAPEHRHGLRAAQVGGTLNRGPACGQAGPWRAARWSGPRRRAARIRGRGRGGASR